MENSRFKFRVWNKILNRYLDKYDPTPMLMDNGLLAYLNEDSMKYYEIEQCTGIKDKNEKLIYEGDIVEVHFGKFLGCETYIYGKVQWYEEEACFEIIGADSDYYEITEELEVIGNIHENADLLEATVKEGEND